MRILRLAWLFIQEKAFLDEHISTLRNANAVIAHWKHEALMGYGSALDTALAMRIAMEQPEVDLRDDVDALICELRDKVARIEEIVV